MTMTLETPRMTRHALQRCMELGITSKRAKRIVQNRTTMYPSQRSHTNNGMIVHSASDTEYGVVWDPETNTILTVLPRTHVDYTRTETGWEEKS